MEIGDDSAHHAEADLVALTGGYPCTPVMQIGADIYCDTALIADVLERIAPEPSLYPEPHAGLSKTLAQWADSALFWTAIPYSFQPAGMQKVFANMPPEQAQGFAADRAKFRGNAPRMSLPEATGQLSEMLIRLEGMLADGKPYLLGARATICRIFRSIMQSGLCARSPALSAALSGALKLAAWADRMAAIGHGQRDKLSSEEALAIARSSTPENLAARSFVDAHGIKLGERVFIQATDYGIDPVEGELVLADHHELAIRRRQSERAGAGGVVHFPPD